VFVSRLNEYNRFRVAIDRILLQSVEIPIQMNSHPRVDVGVDNLIRMTQIWQMFFCCIFSRNPDDVIISKHEINHFDVWCGQKYVGFLKMFN